MYVCIYVRTMIVPAKQLERPTVLPV